MADDIDVKVEREGARITSAKVYLEAEEGTRAIALELAVVSVHNLSARLGEGIDDAIIKRAARFHAFITGKPS